MKTEALKYHMKLYRFAFLWKKKMLEFSSGYRYFSDKCNICFGCIGFYSQCTGLPDEMCFLIHVSGSPVVIAAAQPVTVYHLLHYRTHPHHGLWQICLQLPRGYSRLKHSLTFHKVSNYILGNFREIKSMILLNLICIFLLKYPFCPKLGIYVKSFGFS